MRKTSMILGIFSRKEHTENRYRMPDTLNPLLETPQRVPTSDYNQNWLQSEISEQTRILVKLLSHFFIELERLSNCALYDSTSSCRSTVQGRFRDPPPAMGAA